MKFHQLVAASGLLATVSADYTIFKGDGTPSAQWPSIDNWISWEAMWDNNMKVLNSDSCVNAFNVPRNSDGENNMLKSAILKASQETGVDSRFILAIAMQESNGCVHVHSTVSNDGTVRNPGLMQDHDGEHTCNLKKDTNAARVGQIKGNFLGLIWNAENMLSPCPQVMIEGMVMDGVKGTEAGDGLQQNLAQALSSGGPVNYKIKRQAAAPTQIVRIPAELTACNAVAIAQFSNAVWQAAVLYMQMAYSGSPLTPPKLPAPAGASSASAISAPTSVIGSVASADSAPPTTFSTVSLSNSSYPASEVSSASFPEDTDAASPADPDFEASSSITTTAVAPSSSLPITSVIVSPTPAASPGNNTNSAPASSSSDASDSQGVPGANAVMYYRAARIYNSGQLPNPEVLESAASSTKCYVSDVANRLLGWNGIPASPCTAQLG